MNKIFITTITLLTMMMFSCTRIHNSCIFNFNTCKLVLTDTNYSIIGVTFNYDKVRHSYDQKRPIGNIHSINLCSPDTNIFIYKKRCYTCLDSSLLKNNARFKKGIDCLIFIYFGKIQQKGIIRCEDTFELEINSEDWKIMNTKKAILFRI